MATPIDNTRPATDAENVVMQVDEIKTAASAPLDPNRTSGHILTLDLE